MVASTLTMSAGDDSDRVREIEEELAGIRSAFKDYIANSRVLETGLDRELGTMHNKLRTSSSANETLASQLQNMGPVIESLEASLEKSKQRLQEETRVRMHAEMEREELERLYRDSESSNLAIRQENESLRDELDGTRSQWEELSSRIDSSQRRKGSFLTDDARRSDIETVSTSYKTRDSTTNMDESYLEVLDELEGVTEQLIATQQSLWKTEDKLRESESRVEKLENQKGNSHASELEEQLLESKAENAQLINEFTKFRLTIKPDEAEVDEREQELVDLRQQFKKIFDENSILKERILNIEGYRNGSPERLKELNKEIENLKEENERVSYEVTLANDQSRLALLENSAVWREKLESVREDYKSELLAVQAKVDVSEEIVEGLQNQISVLSKERDILESKVYDLSTHMDDNIRNSQYIEEVREQLKSSQHDRMELTNSLDHLNANLQYSQNIIEKLEKERNEIVIEVDNVLEEGDSAELPDAVKKLCSSFKKTANNDFEDAKKVLLKEARNKNHKLEKDNSTLKQRIEVLEESLETARNDLVTVSEQLEDAQIGYQNVSKQNEDIMERQLNERKNVQSRFDDLVEDKTSLEGRFNGTTSTLNVSEQEIKDLQNRLRESQVALATAEFANSKLKGQLETIDAQETVEGPGPDDLGTQILERLFGENRGHKSRARDPDGGPIDLKETCRLRKLPTNQSNVASPFIYRKDPPSAEAGSFSYMDSNSHVQNMCMRVDEIARGQKLLRENIQAGCAGQNMVCGQQFDAVCGTNESLLALQEQINDIRNSYSRKQDPSIVEKELNSTKSLLLKKDAEIKFCEDALTHSRAEIDNLASRVSQLSDELVKANMDQNRLKEELEQEKERRANEQPQKDLAKMQEKSKKLEEEKSSLESQLEEAKSALFASQSAQERGREDAKLREAKLSASVEEIHVLKRALADLDNALSSLRQDYSTALKDTEEREESNRAEISGFADQLQKLADDNNDLNKRTIDLEGQLALSRHQFEEKCDQVNDLEDQLSSTQREGRFLSEEISNFNTALAVAKEEYNEVLLELGAVNELFEDARQEAERHGRESAAEEIRAEMRSARETERAEIQEKIENSFKENSILLKELTEARKFASDASDKQSDELVAKLADAQREAEVLRESLEMSMEETKRLKENEIHIELDLASAKKELRNAKDDLDHAFSSLNRLGAQAQIQPRSALLGDPLEENTDNKKLRDQMREMISKLGFSSESSLKAEDLKLKVELLDITMSLGKIVRENAILEEEVRSLRKNMDEVRISAEEQGRRDATKKVWAEMKETRDKEMKEFKGQFNSLIQEHVDLEKKVKDSDIARTVANDARIRAERELENIQNATTFSKVEAKKCEQELLKLQLQIEATTDEKEREIDEMKYSMRNESEKKLMGLHQQICNLTIQNASLHNSLRSREMEHMSTQNMEMKVNQELEILVSSLKKSHEVFEQIKEERDRLEIKLKGAETALADSNASRSTNENIVNDLRSRLQSSNDELLKLRSKIAELTKALDVRTMQEKFSLEETSATGQVLMLSKEKAWLQKEADDAKNALFQSQYEQNKQQDELRKCTDQIESFQEELSGHQDAIKHINDELVKAREEHATTMIVLDDIDRILDSANGVDFDDELPPEMDHYATSNQVAEKIRTKIVSLVLALQDGIKQSKMEQQMVDLKEMKYEESKTEAFEFKAEVIRLQNELEEALHEQFSLRKNLENLNSRIIELCMDAEDRGKEIARRELQSSIPEDSRNQLMDNFHDFYEEQSALHEKKAEELVKINRQLRWDLDASKIGVSSGERKSNPNETRLSEELREMHEEFENKVYQQVRSAKESGFVEGEDEDERTSFSLDLSELMDSNVYDA